MIKPHFAFLSPLAALRCVCVDVFSPPSLPLLHTCVCVCVQWWGSGSRVVQDMVAKAGNAAGEREREVAVVGDCTSSLLPLPPPPASRSVFSFFLMHTLPLPSFSPLCRFSICTGSRLLSSILHPMLTFSTLHTSPPCAPPPPDILWGFFSKPVLHWSKCWHWLLKRCAYLPRIKLKTAAIQLECTQLSCPELLKISHCALLTTAFTQTSNLRGNNVISCE